MRAMINENEKRTADSRQPGENMVLRPFVSIYCQRY